MKSVTNLVRRLQRTIDETRRAGNAREHFAAWREVVRCCETASLHREAPGPGDEPYEGLFRLAGQAIRALGGQAEPVLATLDQYDHHRYGPLLGVSDEGSAARAIRAGALGSPKCAVVGELSPMTVGVALDAERLGAVGEVAVGPDEYAAIRLQCMGRILSTTNVGARVNLRHYLVPPVVMIPDGKAREMAAAACRELAREFEPFRKTPAGRSRSLTVFIEFDRRVPPRRRSAVLGAIQREIAAKKIIGSKKHRLGLLATLGSDSQRFDEAMAAIDLAHQRDIAEVALDGRPIGHASMDRLPGLANHFEPGALGKLLAHASACGVRVTPRERVDPQTTARHVWTGLVTARNMGLELGKYGLDPLTLEEQKEVIARIQYWFPEWTAAPACYIDSPLVAADQVYDGPNLAFGIERWLAMVASLKVRVVLIDTARKWEHRRLLKASADDPKGVLTLEQIGHLNVYAARLGIKTLWAGGISMAQTFEFGKLGVFGIYVTSAASALVPLDRHYRRDPALAAVREPDAQAVGRVKLLLEAGFLTSRLEALGFNEEAAAMEDAARKLIALLSKSEKNGKKAGGRRQEALLFDSALVGWKHHFGRKNTK
jgi:hypothetical protein